MSDKVKSNEVESHETPEQLPVVDAPLPPPPSPVQVGDRRKVEVAVTVDEWWNGTEWVRSTDQSKGSTS